MYPCEQFELVNLGGRCLLDILLAQFYLLHREYVLRLFIMYMSQHIIASRLHQHQLVVNLKP
jgi:hypothetical protein